MTIRAFSNREPQPGIRRHGPDTHECRLPTHESRLPNPEPRHDARIAVIKIGGSVLRGPASYRRAAMFVAARLAAHPGERIVVVVSAEHGVTDALLAEARDFSADPDPAALDLLWSTGELKSVALLVLALHGLGVRAACANVHQTGLVEAAFSRDAGPSELRPLRLRALVAEHDAIVAPGFLARSDGDAVVSLGRGGSDLTAVLLAAGLGASRCELVKDVPGYFSGDPNADPEARHIDEIAYSTALEMSGRGCELVQRQALVAARDRNVRVLVRALDAPGETVIHRDAIGAAFPRPLVNRASVEEGEER